MCAVFLAAGCRVSLDLSGSCAWVVMVMVVRCVGGLCGMLVGNWSVILVECMSRKSGFGFICRWNKREVLWKYAGYAKLVSTGRSSSSSSW